MTFYQFCVLLGAYWKCIMLAIMNTQILAHPNLSCYENGGKVF
jgi:hypothetical protein